MPERARRLHRASTQLFGRLDLAQVEQGAVDALRDILNADAAALMLPDPQHPASLIIHAHSGLSEEYVASQRIAVEEARRSYGGDVTDHVVLDLLTEGLGDRRLIAREGLARVLALPLAVEGEFIGSLNAYQKSRGEEFDEQSVDLAYALAAEASVSIHNARLYQDAVSQRDLQRSIFEALGEGIAIVAPSGKVVSINAVAADFLGIDADDGRSVEEEWARLQPREAATGLTLDPDRSPARRALRGEDVHVELIYHHAVTGEERVVDVKARPVRSAGQIVAAVVTMYDLTEMHRLEEEKEQFLSIVSHELRTPLTPLKALAQLLISRIRRSRERSQPLDMDSLERNLASIERQVDRMNGLVSDLLSVSRAGRGKLEMDRRPFDLAETVRDTVERYVEATEEEGRHRFSVDAPKSLTLVADQARIEQMLMNIIGNAVKYSPRGGEVRVALAQHDGRAEIVVADEGIGISREDLGRLGPPFTRGTGRAATFAGMGIGLHVARLLADAHGGTLDLESEGDDRGTTVRISLPT